jgi:dinuclear metal center YbgI/SA1388 family protein
MELNDLVNQLNKMAPPEFAESFDNGKIGLIYGGRKNVNKVVVALDPTPYVIGKAQNMGADMVITHHTLIWTPTNRIDSLIAPQVRMLLDADMSLFAMHTNYDKAPGGVGAVLARRLGMTNPIQTGFAMRGVVCPTYLDEFARMTGKSLDTEQVTFVGDPNDKVRYIVAVPGAGFREAIDVARRMSAMPDVVVSSEMHHDNIRDARALGIALVEVPHYHSEAPAMEMLAERLSDIVEAVYVDDPIEFNKI